jgi:hypothetical protein
MTYHRTLPPISLDDALSTPTADELFIESSGQPKITIQTTLEIQGFTLHITLNDTSISEALAILRRQAQPHVEPAQPMVRQPRQQRHKPRYEAIWCDFDFETPRTPMGAARPWLRRLRSCWS